MPHVFMYNTVHSHYLTLSLLYEKGHYPIFGVPMHGRSFLAFWTQKVESAPRKLLKPPGYLKTMGGGGGA